MRILLINPNSIRPAIPPIGLDYVYDAIADNHEVLFFDRQWQHCADLDRCLNKFNPSLVGITVRNIDNATMFTPREFITEIKAVVKQVQNRCNALVVLGGAGFQIMPREIMAATGADFGVDGEGEVVFPSLLNNLKSPGNVQNIVYKTDKGICETAKEFPDLTAIPASGRRLVDYKAYKTSGTIGNVQTKRGCNRNCIFCPEPQLFGQKIRLRSIDAVIDEINRLKVDHELEEFFFVDSEFNTSIEHAYGLLEEIAGRNIRIKWSCYMDPKGVDDDFIKLASRTGCEMIFWGIDTASEKMLFSLGKSYSVRDIERVTNLCNMNNVACTHILLFGGPQETRDTIVETRNNLISAGAKVVAVATGIRIYPRTPLHRLSMEDGIIEKETDLLRPTYYNENYVRKEIYPHVRVIFSDHPNCKILGPEHQTPYEDENFSKALKDGSYKQAVIDYKKPR